MEPKPTVTFECDDVRKSPAFKEIIMKWSRALVDVDDTLPPWGCRIEDFRVYLGPIAASGFLQYQEKHGIEPCTEELN